MQPRTQQPRARTQTEKDLVTYASQSPRYRFQAFIEQGAQRFALTNGATLHLKAAPFQWVLQFKPGESEGVVMGAAWQRAWVDEVRRSDLRNPLFRIYSSMATAEPPDPESYELFVGRPCASRAPSGDPQDICPGTHVALQIDASVRKDFHTLRPGSHEYVREVRSIRDVSGDTPSPPKPLQDFAGKTLYVVMAETIDAGGKIVDGLNMHDGLRLVNPRYITLVFTR